MARRNPRALWLLVVAGGLTAAVLAAGLMLQPDRPGRAVAQICTDPDAFQIELKRPFTPKGGLMYHAMVGSDSWRTPTFLKNAVFGNVRLGPGDAEDARTRSTAVLCEDDRPLGPAHANPDDIGALGAGRYSHGQYTGILFSTSDGTNPNDNGRRYRALEP
jgi:hypothetical protein